MISLSVDEVSGFVKERYKITALEIVPLLGGWLNEKWCIATPTGEYVFKTLNPDKYKRLCQDTTGQSYIDNSILATLELQNDLNQRGILCPKTYSTEGGLLTTYQDGTSCVLMDYLRGEIKTSETISLEEMYSLGEATSKMLSEMEAYSGKTPQSSLLELRTLLELENYHREKKSKIERKTNPRYVKNVMLQESILADLAKSGLLTQVKKGLIHGDYANDNILFSENKFAGIIDFELVRKNALLQDIGRAIMSFAYHNNSLRRDYVNSFIDGYNQNPNNPLGQISGQDVVAGIKMVWCNEAHLWIKESYYNKPVGEKVTRFMNELEWIEESWFNLDAIAGTKLKAKK